MKKQPERGRGSSYVLLYGRVEEKLMELLSDQVSNIKQVTNLIWLLVAIMNRKSIALSQLANLMLGDTKTQSWETRIRKWLKTHGSRCGSCIK